MNKHAQNDQSEMKASRPSRKARLQALLFSGVALGTTILTLGAAAEPKLPPFRGE